MHKIQFLFSNIKMLSRFSILFIFYGGINEGVIFLKNLFL